MRRTASLEMPVVFEYYNIIRETRARPLHKSYIEWFDVEWSHRQSQCEKDIADHSLSIVLYMAGI